MSAQQPCKESHNNNPNVLQKQVIPHFHPVVRTTIPNPPTPGK